ncbi:hypothetical protein F8271_10440 [Micromonospora sp. ALFpr18c]|uniref:hypothetical protein n=1 Tax=Micromonospora sp. ALFpr18c TaxID=1458665 RepID=UPI00124AF296|nr:hypothetical protein [Micromonospora sp. ALFpr18c]KAB1943178.1 hypothetical protein F8271_10440 [Micromonospora sp. ALFpr18c]
MSIDPSRFGYESYEALDRAGVRWQEALHVLNVARPRLVRHVGAVLHVVGAVPDGRLLAVSLIEETDDAYVVVGARWLDEDEAEPVRKLMERDGR